MYVSEYACPCARVRVRVCMRVRVRYTVLRGGKGMDAEGKGEGGVCWRKGVTRGSQCASCAAARALMETRLEYDRGQ